MSYIVQTAETYTQCRKEKSKTTQQIQPSIKAILKGQADDIIKNSSYYKYNRLKENEIPILRTACTTFECCILFVQTDTYRFTERKHREGFKVIFHDILN